MKSMSKFLALLLGMLAMSSAYADDSEVFTNSQFLSTGVRPNVLFIVDTSGSMDTEVKVYYEDGTVYAGDCPAGRIYWRMEDSNAPPDCATSNQWISVDNNRCRAAALGLADDGWWRGRAQMLNKSSDPSFWSDPIAGQDWKIECRADHPSQTTTPHGDLPGTSAPESENKYPRDGGGNTDADRWGGSKSGNQIAWKDKKSVSLYSSNYANWYKSTDGGKSTTRLKIVQKVAKKLITELNGVNLGLMRYSADADGGMVVYPVSELTPTSRVSMTGIIDGFIAEGNTPLSETMYEAYRYLGGLDWNFGNDSKVVDYYNCGWWGCSAVLKTQPSISTSLVGGTGTKYDSPMDYGCQTTFIVYLTDGLPTTDTAADTTIKNDLGVTCDSTMTHGGCMVGLTKYLHDTDLRSDVVGQQKVITYVIGFGSDIQSSKAYLENIANAGGGAAYTQTDAAGLASTLEEIFSEVVDQSGTTFVAPAVSVNAFNRSQNLNELFVSVFAPSRNAHWPGNLKKYRIQDGKLYGVGSTNIIADNGFFTDAAQALNSPGVVDGPNAAKGGTASTLPAVADRNLYTYLAAEGKTELTDGVNAVKTTNTKITAGKLGASSDTDRDRIINYARGEDYYDEDKAAAIHHKMGDPMHAKPAILIHGGTEDAPEGTVFVPTNDGMLHAFDMNSMGDPENPATVAAEAMEERWAFVPEEYLPQLKTIYENPVLTNRSYALDGDVRVFKYDVNQNGVIDTADGDKAYLFFGTARGGSAYYSLDVTNIKEPKFRWKIDTGTEGFGKLGKTWSAPQIARVQIGDGTGQDKQRFVLIFGGGYDTDNDLEPTPFAYRTEDTSGTELYMVDLEEGKLLWRGGKSGTGLNFVNANMTHSFPANLTVMDTDGDLFADRIYAADMGGQVWRFDIWNKKSADELVTGGVIASLGNKALSTKSAEDNRKFYYAPDVAPMTSRGSHPFMNIAIGSGYRGHPLSGGGSDIAAAAKRTNDRFYSIRDYSPFIKRDQDSYDKATPVTEASKGLVDVTTDLTAVVDDSKDGWMLKLNSPSWRGEKVLAESITAGGVIFFTTFTPLAPDDANPCLSRALNRVWAVYAVDGDPFTHWKDGETGPLKTSDRFTDTKQAGIAPSVNILSNPDSTNGMAICQMGMQILNRCVKVGEAVRSYWETKQ